MAIHPSKYDGVKNPRRYRVRLTSDGGGIVYDTANGNTVVSQNTQRKNASAAAKRLNDREAQP